MRNTALPQFDTDKQSDDWANNGLKSYNSYKDRTEEVLTQGDLLLKQYDLEVVTYGLDEGTDFFWEIVKRKEK